jgi:hypothetical protein
MRRLWLLLECLLAMATAACDREPLPVEITYIQAQHDGHHYELRFELNTEAFWEVEASDETNDVGAFFTIAQNSPRAQQRGLINTGELPLTLGEDYIIRILAYTDDDLRLGRAAIAYTYIDAP